MNRITEGVAKVLLPNDVEWLLNKLHIKLLKSYGHDKQRRSRVLERFAKELIGLVNTMPKHTIAYRIARAIIVSNATPTELLHTLTDLEPPKFGRVARKRAREDMDRATEDKQDPKKKRRSIARLDDAIIVRMVKHILSFVQTLSWGVKRIKKSDELIDFPRLTRTHPIKVMFLDYAKKEEQFNLMESDHQKRPPQRSTYYSICSTLTSKAEKSMTCIDYVQDILVNMRVTGLMKIIEQVVAPTQQERMKEHLGVVQHFLKYQYSGHLSEDDSICSHNIHYGLGLEPPRNIQQIQGVDCCKACKFVDYFVRVELHDAVAKNRSEANYISVDVALAYIQDSEDCFHLYQAHRMRVVNQQRAIAKIDAALQAVVRKTRSRGRTAKVTIDFKQKYLEKRLRSSQMMDFGQRGITWHIVVIEYYDFDAEKDEVVRVQVPLDQILNSGNRQDGPCVLAMLEAMMKMVEVELDWIEEIILVSDNAGCYRSKDMLFPITFLNQKSLRSSGHPLIVKYIHPETQDGKGACDSHAAVAGTHVDRHFICTRKDGTLTYNEACTPAQVTNALCSNGGVKNSAVQLIKLDFPRLAKISKLCSGASEAAKEYFARANEIRFYPKLDKIANWAALDLTDECNWSAVKPLIQVINYSNISEGTVFQIDFSGWDEGKGCFKPLVRPADNPDWRSEMEVKAQAARMIEIGHTQVHAGDLAQSIMQQAMMQVQAAQLGRGMFAQALQDIASEDDESSTNDDDICLGDDDVVLAGDDLLTLAEVEEDHDVADDCIESFFEIEHLMAHDFDRWNEEVEEEKDIDDDEIQSEEDEEPEDEGHTKEDKAKTKRRQVVSKNHPKKTTRKKHSSH